jgi:aspartate 1-decarboxylase
LQISSTDSKGDARDYRNRWYRSGLIIIAAFAQVHEDQVAQHAPQLVFVDADNRQTELRHNVPIQLDE